MRRYINEDIEIGDEVIVTTDGYDGVVVDIMGDMAIIDGPFGEERKRMEELEKKPDFSEYEMTESRKRIIRLTESDVRRLVKRILKEQNPQSNATSSKGMINTADRIPEINNQTANLYRDQSNTKFWKKIKIEKVKERGGVFTIDAHTTGQAQSDNFTLEFKCGQTSFTYTEQFPKQGRYFVFGNSLNNFLNSKVCKTNASGTQVPKATFAQSGQQTQDGGQTNFA